MGDEKTATEPWAAMNDRERGGALAVVIGIPVLAYGEHQGDIQWFDDPGNYPYITDDGDRLIYWGQPQEDGDDWQPTTDPAAARLVEDEIERRGRWYWYMLQLYQIACDAPEMESIRFLHFNEIWFMLHATPAQRCEAAWRALGGT